MASKIEILRAVAAAVGETPPTDENQSTDFLRAMLPIWSAVTSNFAARHAWFWGTTTRSITENSETPPGPWVYAFALPVDRTLIRDVTDESGEPIDYAIQGQRIFTKTAGPLQLRINVAADPSVWPGDFEACVRQTLEGFAWKGLRDEFDRGQALINEVDPPRGLGLLQKAITRDKRQAPPTTNLRGTVYRAFRNALVPRRSRNG